MNPDPRPRLAVVIPVFRAGFLGEALDSVFAQTCRADEVIVVDDGSPDRGPLGDAVGRWGRRLRVIAQENTGAGAARNRGILASDADLIAFLDADDRWVPQHLEVQQHELAAHPACDVVYANAVYIGRTPLAGQRFMDVCPSRGDVTAAALLAQRCHIPLSTAVVRRRALLDAGLFDESLRRGQDFDLWLRMALAGTRFHRHAEVLMHHRIHDDNLSGPHRIRMERAAGVFRKALDRLPLSGAERTLAAAQLRRFEAAIAVERGKDLLTRGEVAAARAALAAAFRAAAHWKVGAALLGLRVAPTLVQRVVKARSPGL